MVDLFFLILVAGGGLALTIWISLWVFKDRDKQSSHHKP